MQKEIEELVKLSYQALDRSLTNGSRRIIKERGLTEAVDIINLSTPQFDEPLPRSAPSRYSPPPPRRPSPPPFHPLNRGGSEPTGPGMARQEVRFTLPKAHLTSPVPNSPGKAEASALNDPPVEKIDDDLRSLHEKHEKIADQDGRG